MNKGFWRLPWRAGFGPGPARPPVYVPDVDAPALFWSGVAHKQPGRILEAGTLQSVPGVSTHCRGHFPQVADADYVRVDLIGGTDVDVVADLHALPASWSGGFDCFIANAVWEHLARPWIAAREVARVLAPGGVFLIGTHQCFPIHGYPSDFFRFSREALRLLFEDAGLVVDAADYQSRCMILPPAEVLDPAQVAGWNKKYPSFNLVFATGHKPAE